MRASIIKDNIFWLLAIFAAIYILANIGTGSLTTWDEALYANVSANIVRTNDWLVMHDRPGKPWFDKPPLYMWCTALFYGIFGISEFSTRLTSSIFGIATVLLVYLFVKSIKNTNTALLAALLLLTAPHYLHFAKLGMMDVMLTFFITLMIYFFWIGQKDSKYLFWSGITLILAYLCKGMAAISGPVIIIFYCLFSGNLRLIIKREFVAGFLSSLVLISIWHVLQYMYGGQGSIDSYFGHHLFERATQSLEGHAGGLNFYQKVVFNKNKPWGIIYYPSLAYILWLAVKDKDKTAILFFVWVITVFVICTAVKTKLHWYIMIVYPALAIASAVFMERLLKKRLFYLGVSAILFAMILQVPISWAFKLDLNPKIKDSAHHFKKLSYEDNGSIFYYETIKMKAGWTR